MSPEPKGGNRADESLNPYVGPQTFEYKHHQLFFGRDSEARELLAIVKHRRLVLFHAESGAGKSSLLNTRLIPALVEDGFEVLRKGRVIATERADMERRAPASTNLFSFNLMVSLLDQQIDDIDVSALELSDFLLGLILVDDMYQFVPAPIVANGLPDDQVTDPTNPITDPSEQLENKLPTEQSTKATEIWPRALIIDQFEEIFTTYPEAWQQRTTFFEQLAKALRDDPYLWIVLVIRDDHIARLTEYAHLLPGRLATRYHMEKMREASALEAVKKPVTLPQYGTEFAAEAALELVSSLRRIRHKDGRPDTFDEYIEPVQLQIVCFQLWRRLGDPKPKPITTEQLTAGLEEGRDLGDFVNEAIADFYESALDQAQRKYNAAHEDDPISQQQLRIFFSRDLITEHQTRSLVFRGKENTGHLPNEAVEYLAEQFIIHGENRGGDIWYELVHDRFLQPILESNLAWDARRAKSSTVAQAAANWQDAHTANMDTASANALLWSGQALVQAQQAYNSELDDPVIGKFLEESEKVERRDIDNRNRRFRLLTTLALLSALTAIILIAYLSTRSINNSARDFRNERSIALAKKAREFIDIGQVGRGLGLAIGAVRVAPSDEGRPAILRGGLWNQVPESWIAMLSPRVNSLLLTRQPIPMAVADALAYGTYSTQLLRSGNHGKPIIAADYHAPSGRLIIGDIEGNLAIWDTNCGKFVWPSEALDEAAAPVHTGEVWTVAFSPDGERALSGDDAGNLLLWRIKPVTASNPRLETVDDCKQALTVTREQVYTNHQGAVRAAAFNPETNNEFQAITGDTGGRLLVWNFDQSTDAPVKQLHGHHGWIFDVAISPDGGHALSTEEAPAPDQDGPVLYWDLTTGISETVHHEGDNWIRAAEFVTATGVLLARSSVVHWDLADRKLIGKIVGQRSGSNDQADYIVDMQVYDGKLLTAGVEADVWDLRSGEHILTLAEHPGHVITIAAATNAGNWVSAAFDGSIHQWDAQQGIVLNRIGFDNRLNSWSQADIPRECNNVEDYGSLGVGSTVVLGRHESVNGSTNWTTEMEPYVGRQAIIQSLAVSSAGCPIASVDIDGGSYVWRIRAMTTQSAMAFLDANDILGVARTAEGLFLVWDVDTELPLRQFRDPTITDVDLGDDHTAYFLRETGAIETFDLLAYQPSAEIELDMTSGERAALALHVESDDNVFGVSYEGEIWYWAGEPGTALTHTIPISHTIPDISTSVSSVTILDLSSSTESGRTTVERVAFQVEGADATVHNCTYKRGDEPECKKEDSESGILATEIDIPAPTAVSAASPTGAWVAALEYGDRLSVYRPDGFGNTDAAGHRGTSLELSDPATSLAYLNDDDLLTGHYSGQVRAWHIEKKDVSNAISNDGYDILASGDGLPVDRITISHNGQFFAILSRDGDVTVWKSASLNSPSASIRVDLPVVLFEIGSNGHLVTGDMAGRLTMWDPFSNPDRTPVVTTSELRSLQDVGGGVTALATMGLDGSAELLALGRDTGTARSVELWYLPDTSGAGGEQSGVAERLSQKRVDAVVTALALSSENHLAIGDSAGELRLYSVHQFDDELLTRQSDEPFAQFMFDAGIAHIRTATREGEQLAVISLDDASVLTLRMHDHPQELYQRVQREDVRHLARPCSEIKEILPEIPAEDWSYWPKICESESDIIGGQQTGFDVTESSPVPESSPQLTEITIGEHPVTLTREEQIMRYKVADEHQYITISFESKRPQSDATPLEALERRHAVPGVSIQRSTTGDREQLAFSPMRLQPGESVDIFLKNELLVDEVLGDYSSPLTLSIEPLILKQIDVDSAAKGEIDLGQRELWSVMGEASAAYRIRMDAFDDGSNLDPYLRVYAADGVTELKSDDDSGEDTDAQIDRFAVGKGETFIVEAAAYSDGSSGPYLISLEEIHDLQDARDMGTIEPATPQAGLIEAASAHLWSVDIDESQVVQIDLAADAGPDAVSLRILEPDGTELPIWQVSEDGPNRSRATTQSAGRHHLLMRNTGQSTAAYTLTLTINDPVTKTLNKDEPASATLESGVTWLYEGVEGEWIDVSILSEEHLDIAVTVYTAGEDSSRPLVTSDLVSDSQNPTIRSLLLHTNDQYRIRVNALQATGAYTLTVAEIDVPELLYESPQVGTAADFPIWRFSGKASQLVRIIATMDDASLVPLITLKEADGRILESDYGGEGLDTELITALPAAGTYYIEVGPPESTSQYELRLTAFEEADVPAIEPGSPVTAHTADQKFWRYAGTAGRVIQIDLSTSDPTFDPYVTLRTPDWGILAQNDDGGFETNARIRTVLPDDGLYFVETGRAGSAIDYRLRVAELTVPALPLDSTVATTSNDNAVWQFEGNRGQIVQVGVQGDIADRGSSLTLRNDEWSALATLNLGESARLSQAMAILPEDGHYYVDLDRGSSTDALRVSLSSVNASLLSFDSPVMSSTDDALIWTFSTTEDTFISLDLESLDGTFDPYLSLWSAEGESLATDDDSGEGPNGFDARIQRVLMGPGEYYVSIRHSEEPARYRLTLSQSKASTLTADSPVTSRTVDDVLWQFTGPAGQIAVIDMQTDDPALDPNLVLRTADWTALARDDDGGNGTNARIYGLLAAEGLYYIETGRAGGAAEYELSLTITEVPTIAAGIPITSTTGANPFWRFAGAKDQVVTLTLDALEFDPELTLLDASGVQIDYDDDSGEGLNARLEHILPADGIYYVKVGRGGSDAEYTLRLNTRD